jgi:phosphoribosylformylglycinamidine cyclo-ligase
VGVIEKSKLINGKKIKPGHLLLAIESSGPHSNGYSLIRKILNKHKPPEAIIKSILKPTNLYSVPILELIKNIDVKGMAHITGGGLTDNVPRILKKNLVAEINLEAWKFPPVFKWLQEVEKISKEDMLRIFNCGIGMVCIIEKNALTKAQKNLN